MRGLQRGHTRLEIELTHQRYGCSPIQWLDRLEVLDENTLLDHCVWLDDRDLELIAQRRATVAHCPVSNAKLGSGVAPIPQLLDRGIAVGLGSDSMRSNNSQDLFSEMKTAALLQRIQHLDGTIYTTCQLPSMATIDGARTLGWDAEIGSLEVGKRADVIVVDAFHPCGLTQQRVLSDLVHSTGQYAQGIVAGQLAGVTFCRTLLLVQLRQLPFVGVQFVEQQHDRERRPGRWGPFPLADVYAASCPCCDRRRGIGYGAALSQSHPYAGAWESGVTPELTRSGEGDGRGETPLDPRVREGALSE